MKNIYLSPHLDDVVFSCGGWIWEQVQKGQEVEIWTIFAGDSPPGELSELANSIHQSWELTGDVVETRREEDRKACRILGAKARHLSFPDSIYRISPAGEPYYQQRAEIFGGLDPREVGMIDRVKTALLAILPETAHLIVPLAIGNHVDHEVVRKAASRLERSLSFYADYPYVREEEGLEIIRIMESSHEWLADQRQISAEGLERWWRAAGAYESQLSTFWKDGDALKNEIMDYSIFWGGFKLWRAVEEGP